MVFRGLDDLTWVWSYYLFPFLALFISFFSKWGGGGSVRPYSNKRTSCTRIFFCVPLGKQCHVHSQPETVARADSQPQVTAPLQNITPPVGFLPRDVPSLTPPPNQLSLVQSHDIPEPPAPTQPRQSAATVQPWGLAQPIGGTWAKNLNQAESQRQNTKNLKVQQHAMDEQMKRTCLFVVYHTVCLITILNTDGCLKIVSEWKTPYTHRAVHPIFSSPSTFHSSRTYSRSRAPGYSPAWILERRMGYHWPEQHPHHRKGSESSPQDMPKPSDDSRRLPWDWWRTWFAAQASVHWSKKAWRIIRVTYSQSCADNCHSIGACIQAKFGSSLRFANSLLSLVWWVVSRNSSCSTNSYTTPTNVQTTRY